MKTRFLIVLLIAGTLSSFAQKKELRAVSKALKGGDYAGAKNLLSTVEGMMGALSDDQKVDFYLYKCIFFSC